MLAQAPNVLVVHPSLQTKSVKELIALAKARPGQLSYSSSGTGDTGHLAMELLKQTAGVDIVHIPYKGAAPSVAALVAGEVGVSINNLIVALPQVKANRIRALAVTSARRAATLPDIPALAEAGLPGFHAIGWFAVFAPAKTPPAIVAKLSDDIRAVLDLPDVKQSIATLGAEATGSSWRTGCAARSNAGGACSPTRTSSGIDRRAQACRTAPLQQRHCVSKPTAPSRWTSPTQDSARPR